MSEERAKASILVVDDTPDNLRVLSQMLTEHGYRIRAASSGQRALESVQANPPDLILLDIVMPGMNGYEICQRLKADVSTSGIPVIFISALDATQDKVTAFAVGGVDYVTKPLQLQEVLARVETHLALRELQKRLQQANQQLERQVQELQARNEELDAFAHTVAHDLTNPVSLIIGYAEMLEEEYDGIAPDKVLNYARLIGRGGRKLNNIIEELLLLASVRKMEEVDLSLLDTASLVKEVQVRLADLIETHQAEIVSPQAWPVALGYPAWVEEIWANYISNAIKYGGRPPRVELGFDVVEGGQCFVDSVSQVADLPPVTSHFPLIRFWVRDNGPGLSAEEQARLFTPFTRIHQARAKGHGLGLSIVRRIVEKLGGQAGLESQVGQGSTFYFILPAAE